MRSYRQYCALARALDVVGERWTLLIIRELFAGDCRYSDLRDNLPGIASNLLAQRLRQLQTDGVVEAYQATRPARGTAYRLTERGRELGPAIRALVSWGGPLAVEGQGTDEFRTHWMTLGLPTYFDGVEVSDLAPLTVTIQTGDEPATLRISGDELVMTPGSATDDHMLVVTGPPGDVFAVLTGTAGSGVPDGVDIRGPQESGRKLHELAARSELAVR